MMQPPYQPAQTLIREYKNAREYQQDAQKLARDGWRVVSSVQGKGSGQRTTYGNMVAASSMILFGPFALLFRSRKRLIITYTR